MSFSLLPVALLAASALAAPRPEVEVVQVRELVKRQDPTSTLDLSDIVPTDLGDLSTLIPSGLELSDLASLIPTDLGNLVPSSVNLDSLISDLGTLLPTGLADCLPPSDLPPAPTIPSDVLSVYMTYTDVCQEPSLTGSVAEHYSSYLSELSQYGEENAPQITSWLDEFGTACPYASLVPTGADLSSLLASYTSLASCGSFSLPTPMETGTSAMPTGSAASGGSEEPTGTETGAPTSAGSAAPEENTGAAPQQTAFAAVVGAVAGFAGIVAAL